MSKSLVNTNAKFGTMPVFLTALSTILVLLSGDLKDPKKSIPKGTLWATFVGMLVYIAVAWKFTVSASPEELVSDQLIMQKIALWGPIVPTGLAAASLSSALGSI